MEAIGELHQDDPDVVDHRQQHLAEVLGLPLLAGRKGDGADLGDPLDDVRHFGAEMLLNLLDAGESVFNDVMEQAGGDGHRVEAHLREHAGHLQWMHQVGLP